MANVYDGTLDTVCSYLAQIDVDGKLDPSFGLQGLVLVREKIESTSKLLMCRAVAIDAAGQIIVAGTAAGIGVLARFDATGNADQLFGADGRVRITNPDGRCEPRDIIAVDDGLIVFCAFFGVFGVQLAALIRLMPDGTRDNGFNRGDPAIADLAPYAYAGVNLVIDQARRIVVGGFRYVLEDGFIKTTAVMSRFMPLGMLDTLFGIGGHCVFESYISFVSLEGQGIQKILTLAREPATGDTVVARFIG